MPETHRRKQTSAATSRSFIPTAASTQTTTVSPCRKEPRAKSELRNASRHRDHHRSAPRTTLHHFRIAIAPPSLRTVTVRRSSTMPVHPALHLANTLGAPRRNSTVLQPP
ncbi:hypothetical protein DEO72_LG11g1853 [Vigna unguiculata]|uniref:Uncharacterized protein n=1 Tax=Vigna unguiculata TaxID=3917 RepID=A0A4D6NSV7_VIGUN|nr:hypothetical protein DEO72_LG11g1853 [Vigna unguiculata]